MNIRAVEPAYVSTFNPIWPWQYLTGKRWTVTCGHCSTSFRIKLPIAPLLRAVCPGCNAPNQWRVEVAA